MTKRKARMVLERIAATVPGIQRALRISGGQVDVEEPSRTGKKEQIQSNQARPDSKGPPWLIISFLVFVVVPGLGASFYFSFIASDQFVSQLQFVIRGTTERLPGSDALGPTGGLAYLNSNQEVYAVADYLRSGSSIEKIGQTMDLRQVFRRADWFSRIEDNTSSAELVRFWRSMISVLTEPASGLISVEVRAFSRDDATGIASAILRESELLVNRMKERLSGDMVTRAEQEVRTAYEHARRARAELAEFRSLQTVINPLDTARSLIDTATELKRELIAANVELASAKASMGPDAPNVRTIDARRTSLLEQIQNIERRITSANSDDLTAAKLLVDYDKLEIGQTLAEQQVAVSERILEKLKTEANRTQITIQVIEGPTRPQSALLPYRTHSSLMVTAAALSLWGVIVFGLIGIREHAE
jgi:capsular polysaccharide transport system permease protein